MNIWHDAYYFYICLTWVHSFVALLQPLLSTERRDIDPRELTTLAATLVFVFVNYTSSFVIGMIMFHAKNIIDSRCNLFETPTHCFRKEHLIHTIYT